MVMSLKPEINHNQKVEKVENFNKTEIFLRIIQLQFNSYKIL